VPRLHGIIVYRFVEPGATAFIEERFRVISDSIAVEAYAEALEKGLRDANLQVGLCAELGHEHAVGGCRHLEGAEWYCARRLRVALASVRTAARTVLVRIEVP
jgi:hypothetical protein